MLGELAAAFVADQITVQHRNDDGSYASLSISAIVGTVIPKHELPRNQPTLACATTAAMWLAVGRVWTPLPVQDGHSVASDHLGGVDLAQPEVGPALPNMLADAHRLYRMIPNKTPFRTGRCGVDGEAIMNVPPKRLDAQLLCFTQSKNTFPGPCPVFIA